MIYKGVCLCGAEYIGETSRCEQVRFAEEEEEEEEEEESIYFLVKNYNFTRGMLARGLSASRLAPSPTHVHDNAQHPYLKT